VPAMLKIVMDAGAQVHAVIPHRETLEDLFVTQGGYRGRLEVARYVPTECQAARDLAGCCFQHLPRELIRLSGGSTRRVSGDPLPGCDGLLLMSRARAPSCRQAASRERFYRFLWEIRDELFAGGFEDELITSYCPRGRRPVAQRCWRW